MNTNRQQATWLLHDPKNIYENSLVVEDIQQTYVRSARKLKSELGIKQLRQGNICDDQFRLQMKRKIVAIVFVCKLYIRPLRSPDYHVKQRNNFYKPKPFNAVGMPEP